LIVAIKVENRDIFFDYDMKECINLNLNWGIGSDIAPNWDEYWAMTHVTSFGIAGIN